MFTNARRSVAVVLTSVVAVSTILSASAASTTKNLSSNFTLVNLVNGANTGQISYIKTDGTAWRSAEPFNFAALGDQAIKRQYDDSELDPGSGSVVVSTDGPVGAVVQIQARDGQVPTSGSYVGVSEGAAQANVPLVSRQANSASGATNSQIIIQNASSIPIDVVVDLIDLGTGNIVFTKNFTAIPPNASVEYDLDTEGGLPTGWFGSASVRSTTTGGEVAVVSNFFTGPDAMQTFNAFTAVGTQWAFPAVFSRLGNSLSSPITVQNVSGGVIPPGEIDMVCVKEPGSAGTSPLNFTNANALQNNQSIAFNPVTDNVNWPDSWVGACRVNTGTFNTAAFAQLRFVAQQRAAAYEGILATSTNRRVVIPLYAHRLIGASNFSSAISIVNLNPTTPAHVTLEYKKGAPDLPDSCNLTIPNVEIAGGGSLNQNLRVVNGVPGITEGCVGTLTVTSSDQPIDAIVQLDFLNLPAGDPYMAHNTFTVAVP